MKTSGTIRYMIENGETLSAHHELAHPQCTHSSDLDLAALAARLGPEFDVVENRNYLLSLLRCSKCGRKGNMSIIHHPNTTRCGGRPIGLEAGAKG